MVWLKLAADTLVHICMLLGTIFGVPPALLGATVLAWGNSMPDLANNLSLARDGYPTMAITACFASPACWRCRLTRCWGSCTVRGGGLAGPGWGWG